ncbi:UTRA domain-containing protein [Klebsiella pneumoniae subsp. pneumoniae]|nr:UTRA domain-containing protein [Klebsiella pneumoniae subsp. pneumoniae]
MGLELLEAYETISARQPSSAEASLLELSVHDVVLTCTRVTLSVNRKPMEYVEMIYPASRYSYEIKITKDKLQPQINLYPLSMAFSAREMVQLLQYIIHILE